ncbi:hypothetical protein NEOLEDRAFT_1056884 [Neolentinus lepideus HHB14362 ss-1]|uniref:MYND-type domain-containing protein n=1 Tax=Neolentinus lepideus HHB14362 ss-1 TaxID=1314782 RepID=A0A165V3H4_9AGAM|nr:hypothetical protein NEOLEDRAFT_1056884 [Neolentinus lepideus HHB14362 ss-1]
MQGRQSHRAKERCMKCGFEVGFEVDKLYNCSGCKGAAGRYCGAKCQKEHWPVHKPICRPLKSDEVWGINILPNQMGCLEGGSNTGGDDDREKLFEHVLLKINHPVFSMGELCPVTRMAGLPLIVYSGALMMGVGIETARANQAAVYLRIEPDNGLAPIQFCIVVRQDRRPLTRQTIETMWQFAAKLIDAFGYPTDDGWAPVKSLMVPAYWQMFSRDYYEEQQKKGRVGFDSFWEPL